MVSVQVLAGMAAGAAAAFCFDGAVLLQSAEARTVEPEHGLHLSLIRRLAHRPRWLLGTTIALLGWPLQLLALSLAPLTLVQPTLALGLILLLASGPRLLHEPVNHKQWAAAATVITGVLLLALLAPPHTTTTPNPTATP